MSPECKAASNLPNTRSHLTPLRCGARRQVEFGELDGKRNLRGIILRMRIAEPFTDQRLGA